MDTVDSETAYLGSSDVFGFGVKTSTANLLWCEVWASSFETAQELVKKAYGVSFPRRGVRWSCGTKYMSHLAIRRHALKRNVVRFITVRPA